MIILLDQDGVLGNYTALLYERWCDRHPKEFDTLHVSLDCVPYNVTSHYTGLPQTHLKAIENEPGFFESIPPIPGAVEAAKELVSLGHQVCVCTRPSRHVTERCASEKYRWIAQNLGSDWVERMMVVRDKTYAYGHILIDDNPHITGAVEQPVWKHVLYDCPYNKDVLGPRLSWDMNWREVISKLEEELEV